MATRDLPADPNLENLKKQAKRLLKSVKSGDAEALARIAPYFGDPAALGLQDAQLVLAREHGFASWSRLKAEVEKTPGAALERVGPGPELADRFLHQAMLTYSESQHPDDNQWDKAAALLAAHPEIRDASIHTAAACGDVARLARWLDDEPGLLEREGGPFGWAPLMYAAYSRLPGVSTLEAGRFLLARSANPNLYFMWGGQYRFTALTGVFGQGEGGPERLPEHPDFAAFARLLLEAGADPNDSQAAYNRMFLPDDTCLELLLEFGLGPEARCNWLLQEDGQLVPHHQTTLHYQLANAVKAGLLRRVRLLAGRGVDLDEPDQDRTLYEWALLGGHDEIAEFLLAQGATEVALREVALFRGACLAGERGKAEEMLARSPGLIEEVLADHPHLLHNAAGADNAPAVELMIDLGFDPNRTHGAAPLHHAAAGGRLEMVKLLISRGADPAARDQNYFANAAGWAEFHRQPEVESYLESQALDVHAAAGRGRLPQLAAGLDADPSLLNAPFSTIRPSPERPCVFDWMTPLAFAVRGGHAEAVRLLLERGADPGVRDPDGKTLADLAREAGHDGVAQLLEAAAKDPTP